MRLAPGTRAVRYAHLVVLTGIFLLLGSAAASAAKATFTLQSIRGRVEMQRGGKGEWAAVKRGSHEASVGDRVRTGRESSVVIVTGDGGRISLGAETEVVLREPDRPRGWRLILGRVKAFFTGNKGLEVRTPSAVAAVEGTTLQLEVGPDGTTVLTVAEGAVRFYNDFGSVTVLSSQQSIAAVGQPPTRPIVVDPSSLMAWEASIQTLLISPEVTLVSSDPARLQQELTARRAAVAQHPDDPEAHVALAAVLLDLRQTEEAIAEAQRAVALAPEAGSPQGVLGYALLQAGRPAAAQQAFARAAAAQPEEARWQTGLGLVALGENDTDTAIASFTRAASLAPQSAAPRAYLAAAFLRGGDLAKATAAANGAVTLAPDSGLARSYQAYVLLAQGDTSGAVAAAKQAVAAAPQSALAREALGTALTFSGQYAAADTELVCALSLNPASAGAHLTRAKLLAAEGQLEEALAEGKVAVALDPKSAPARSTLGLLFLLNNDPRHAGQEFEQALAVSPSLSEARTGWGQVLFARGRFREALEQQKLAVSLDTGSASAENNLGGTYASLGRMAEAREHLLCAIQLQPDWGMPYANLAAMYLELNLIPEALEAGERAVALGEQSAFAHTVLARIYLRQGRVSQAVTELRIAVALDNLYPLAHYQLARIYLDEGRSRDAVREILFAVTTDPSAMLDTRLYARTELSASAGSYSQWSALARYSAQAAEGQLSYYASGLLDGSDGWRPVNQGSAERFFELVAGDQPRPTQQFALFSTYLDRDNGLPGPETPVSAGDPDDEQDFTGYDGVLAYRQRLSRRLTSTLKYTYRHDELDFRNPDSLSDNDDNPFLRLTHEDAEYSPELRLDANLTAQSTLSMGYAHLSDHIDSSGVASVFDPDTGELVPYPFVARSVPDTNTAWLQVDSRVSPQLDLTVGGLWGREEGADHVISPKVVALYFPDRLSWWAFVVDPVFRADIAELAPVEALANPYGLSYLDFAGGGVGRTYQLEYQRQGSRVSTATASLAYQQVRDLLVNIEDPEWTGLPSRLLLDDGSRWLARAAYEQWLTDTVTGRAWVQWQTSNGDFPDLGVTDTEWPYTPTWQAGVRADYIAPSGLQVGLEAVGVDRRFANAQNTETVPGYTVLNLLVQYQHGLRQSYFVTLANLTDRDYDTFAGFPQPGRSVLVGLTYRY
jgi:tetratricopeptide (TPR) repeat protein